MPDRPDKNIGPDMEGPGAQLRRAREKRGLLIHDIAQELHLDEWMLEALEKDDFAALGAPVFAKGHMRKYGSLLELNTDDLMIAYYRKRGRDDSPPPITKISRAEPDKPQMSWRWLRWIVVVVVSAVVLSLGWTLYKRVPVSTDTQSVVPASSPIVVESATEMPLPEPVTEGLTAESTLPLTVPDAAPAQAETTAVETEAEATGAVTAAAPPAEEEVPAAEPAELQLRVSVSDDSWVEVTDSTGRRLIYDMVAAGRTRNVSGQPPIEVFLGLSRSVRLDVNGRFYAVPRSAVRGNTARFVIDPAADDRF